MLRTTNSTAVVVLRGKKGAVNFHSRRPDNCREERDLTHIVPQNAAENCAHTNSLAISEDGGHIPFQNRCRFADGGIVVVVDFQTLSFPTLQMNCVWEELLNFRWQSSGHPPIDPAFVVLKSFQPFINMFRGQPEYVCSDEFRVIISKVDTDFKVRWIIILSFRQS